MIGRLSGTIATSRPDEVIVDVSGVGYRVQIPLSTFYRLADRPGVVSLEIYTHVREDAIQLFGFWTDDERTTFQRLIAVSGIGPKIALAVLSGIGVADLERAVQDGDRGVLERIPGIGRKTAERVLLELRSPSTKGRGRVVSPGGGAGPAVPSASTTDPDAVAALVRLGYSDVVAQGAITAARRELGTESPIEALLRAALRALVR